LRYLLAVRPHEVLLLHCFRFRPILEGAEQSMARDRAARRPQHVAWISGIGNLADDDLWQPGVGGRIVGQPEFPRRRHGVAAPVAIFRAMTEIACHGRNTQAPPESGEASSDGAMP
jgi:hypothetical protein